MFAFKVVFVLIYVKVGHFNEDVDPNKIAELFSQLDNDTYKVKSEIANNPYNSVMCWLETINSIEYKNGTKSMDRQFSIILETPADLSNKSLENNTWIDGTKRTKSLNFTTLYKTKNFIVKVNKTLICGAGPVMTKEYIAWPDNKKRVQINLGTKKILENYARESVMRNKYISNEKLKLFLNKDQSEKKVIVGKKIKRAPKTYNLKTDECCKDLTDLQTSNKTLPSREVSHKLNIKIQVTVEYRAVSNLTKEITVGIPLLNAQQIHDYNIGIGNNAKFHSDRLGDFNKSFERFTKLLAREYGIEYLNKINPFQEYEGQINSLLNQTSFLIQDDPNITKKICCIRRYLQT